MLVQCEINVRRKPHFIMFCLHAVKKKCEKSYSLTVFVPTGGIVNVMPLLYSQISHNKTQVNVIGQFTVLSAAASLATAIKV